MDVLSSPFLWLGIMVVLLAVLMLLNMQKRKKMQGDHVNFIESLKVGDRVRTHIGIFGKISAIKETTAGKVFVLEIGEKHKSEMEVDYRVIAGPDDKEMLQLDAEGNPIYPEPAEKKSIKKTEKEKQTEEQKMQETVAPETANEIAEVATETQKTAKPTSKKKKN